MAFERTSSGNWFHSINHPNPSSRLISNGNRHRQRSSCKLRKKKMLKFGCTFLLLLCCCESNSDFCWYRKMDEDKLNFIYLYFLCLTIQQLHFILFFSMNIDIIFFFEIWLNQFIDINFDRRKLYNEFKIEFKY